LSFYSSHARQIAVDVAQVLVLTTHGLDVTVATPIERRAAMRETYSLKDQTELLDGAAIHPAIWPPAP